MSRMQQIIDVIYVALRALNAELDADSQVALAPGTKLFGPEASLDSLSLVSLIVDVETAIADQFGQAVSLTDDQAMSQPVSPFSDVQTLANYIQTQLKT